MPVYNVNCEAYTHTCLQRKLRSASYLQRLTDAREAGDIPDRITKPGGVSCSDLTGLAVRDWPLLADMEGAQTWKMTKAWTLKISQVWYPGLTMPVWSWISQSDLLVSAR